MSDNLAKRLEELEGRYALLEREVSALRGGRSTAAAATSGAAPRPAPVEEGARTTIVAPPGPDQRFLPTREELAQLFDLVFEQHPRFRPRAAEFETPEQARQRHVEAFGYAFAAVMRMGRAPAPDRTRSVGFWAGHAREIIEAGGIVPPPALESCFLGAVFAAGNVLFTPYVGTSLSISLGLTYWGHWKGDRPTDSWRTILRTRRTLEPVWLDEHEREHRRNGAPRVQFLRADT